ncbi:MULTISPECIES: LysR family transcriptional regulator [unclassified Methylobacterium]|uniref:LysR family transcriptional regulator n=1 Tax=unclassified Methylobacterium TaxID=2615210 RepID=UPI00314501B2
MTRAAADLHRVPSNVTTRIKPFEERLGGALFRRQGRSLALTEAGRTVLGHAEKLLRMADAAERDLRGGTVRGVLRLGALESAAGAWLPPICRRSTRGIRTSRSSFRPVRLWRCGRSRSPLPRWREPARSSGAWRVGLGA